MVDLTDRIKLNIAFVHPDLGIGGAERLVVDLAYGLQGRGHNVHVYTSHYDPTHCFEETKELKITTFGDNLPRGILGLGYILFAYLRALYLAVRLVFAAERYDVVVIDQLSLTIPILRFTQAKVIFYCHFPDQLLAKKGGLLKKAYRLVFDSFEEYTIKMADEVLVNSEFTKETYRRTFRTIKDDPEVLYPGIKTEKYKFKAESAENKFYATIFNDSNPLEDGEGPKLFTSINRYEMKKNVGLAIDSFVEYKKLAKGADAKYRLVIAGGYDTRVQENVDYLKILIQKCEKNNLKYLLLESAELNPKTNKTPAGLDETVQVIFIKNFSESLRNYLLNRSTALLYTPENEHFGIVPVEAMYCELPVIAPNSGGPRESIISGSTGFLCEPTAQDFAKALINCAKDKQQLGKTGKLRVEQHFTMKGQVQQFADILINSLGLVHYNAFQLWIASMAITVFSGAVIVVAIYNYAYIP